MTEYHPQQQQQPLTYAPSPPLSSPLEKPATTTTTTISTPSPPQAQPWSNGYWDCCSPGSLCFLSCCCPCFVFGKTQARNAGDAHPSSLNPMCLGWYCLSVCGMQWALQAMKRNSYRNKHKIAGNGCMDCLGSACCACCGLMQEEKESLLREGKQRGGAGGAGGGDGGGEGYQPNPGMSYQ